MTRARLFRGMAQWLAAGLVVGGRLSSAQGAPPISMPEADRVRIAEAFRVAEAVGDRLWTGWSSAPFALLLVTPEREFLVRHPAPTSDFVAAAGTDPLLGGLVWSRPRQFDVGLLASFPAVGGVPTIVIGQAANTAAKRSTAWVLTVLHEHFHQLQTSRDGYYEGVNGLGLSGGDRSGNWMLDYPFPYGRSDVQQQFATMCARLVEALASAAGEPTILGVRRYLDAKRGLRALVSDADYVYLNFQLWQEGISRYTELRVAELAASQYAPTKALTTLPDFTTFDTEAQALAHRIRAQLTTLALGEAKRTAFYAVGAAEGLLLDRVSPSWHDQYATARFELDGLLATAVR